MDFNPRMSSVRPAPGTHSKQKREEENSFMTLPDHEIASCINDIGINFSLADLHKPNPQQIQKVFEWFAELLTNTTREAVSPAMRAAANDMCGNYGDVFTADTRDLMGFFVILRKLLVECGIHDFSFSDLYKPTRERLVKNFSYIINFIRFRESQTANIDMHFSKSEKTKARIEFLYRENQNKDDHLRELERNRRPAELAIQAKDVRTNELKNILQGLKADQERVIERLESVKSEQSRLKAILEDKTAHAMITRQAVQKLRPYTEQSPQALEASLRDLSDNLNNDKSRIEVLDRRARALQTSCDSFSTVNTDVRTCINLLGDLQRELTAEESASLSATKNRDALSERSNNVRDVERQERMLQKQLENFQRKIEGLHHSAEAKRQDEKERMEELKKVNAEIKSQRATSGREMERRRVRIEQTEKKMADLRENVENEIHAAHEEYMTMDSHIQLYIKEMESSIT